MEGGKREDGAGPSDCGCSSVVTNKGKEEEEEEEEEEKKEVGVATESPDHSSNEDDHQEFTDVICKFVPGPLLPLKDQLDKDKDDDSLRRWKEKLLGSIESDFNGQMNPEVKFQSIGIISDDIGEITTPLPVEESHNDHLFTLREGAQYQLKLTFTVLHNIVSGLAYSNTVWKGGIQVDRSKGMLGTFAPQKQPYVETLEEGITPSGVLARGIYTAKLKFEDDDRRCHLELDYSFEIHKSR